MRKPVLTIACCAALFSGCAMMEEKEPTATATLEPRSGSNVSGTLTFSQVGDVVRVTGEIKGHTKGPKGFHIHEKGDCSAADALSAAGHFNPHKSKHGGPYEPVKHAGDLGNITFKDRKSTRLNSSHSDRSRMPSSA